MDDAAEALVIGGGPAGLMAAETLAAAGRRVVLTDAMPTVGRKLLMAGKSGLNLTKAEPPTQFAAAYSDGADRLAPLLAAFGPEAVVAWAAGLGIETFTGTSGRVFPVAMKASPLLRAWLRRIEGMGVALRARWRWTGWEGAAARFETPGGPRFLTARVTILALGGASWTRLGSDGRWAGPLAAAGAPLEPFAPSNVGFGVAWSPAMARHFGMPVKPVLLRAGGQSARGECVVTARGLEGGALYALGPVLRRGAPLTLDLLPDRNEESVAERLARPHGRLSLANHLRRQPGLSPVKIALLREAAPDALGDPEAMARALKALPLSLTGPNPIVEAISTAGGLAWEGLDADLGLAARPGVFCAGEMIAWDAPTGGYLLTACLATGRHAGTAADRFLAAHAP